VEKKPVPQPDSREELLALAEKLLEENAAAFAELAK